MATNTVKGHLNNINVRLDKTDELVGYCIQLLNVIKNVPTIQSKLMEDVELKEIVEKIERKISVNVTNRNTTPNINNTYATNRNTTPNINNTHATETGMDFNKLIKLVKKGFNKYLTLEGAITVAISVVIMSLVSELKMVLWEVVCVATNAIGVAIGAVICANPITTTTIIIGSAVIMLTSWLIYSSNQNKKVVRNSHNIGKQE